MYSTFLFYLIFNHTGSLRKHETLKSTWRLLKDILERMKGPSIKQICEELVRLNLIESFNRGLVCLYRDEFKK